MTFELASFFAGLATTLLPLVLAVAVSYGRFKQVVSDLAEVVDKLDTKVQSGLEKLSSLETTSESHSERLDRLELPLFQRRQ